MTHSKLGLKPAFYWNMSWRMLWRDWRGGELNILLFGLIIAVTSITAVGFFTDRIERGLSSQSAELIAADLVVSSPDATVRDHIALARKNDLQVAVTASFRSIILADGRPQLVEVKSVSDGYPLRGTLRTSEQAFTQDSATTSIPARGELWVEPRLLDLLGMEVGSAISLGNSSFVISRVLRYEPDRAGDLFSLAPRVMMNEADLDATGLIGVGARVSYRLLLAGSIEQVDTFRQSVTNELRTGEKLLSVEEGRPELNTALNSARQFLGLAALISVLLAGVAVATVANRYSRRHLGTSAMYRCLGASQRTIVRLFLLEMLWLALIASTIGCLFGSVTQLVITSLLDQLVLAQLPLPSLMPLLLGYATGIILLIGFALPPLLSLHRVPPLHVLRKDVLPQPVSSWTLYTMVTASMALLLYWQIGDIRLVSIVFAGIIATLLLLAGAAYLLVLMMDRQRSRVGVAWRFGMANISRRPASSVIQIVAFGLGIMVLLLLTTVRTDLLDDWQRSLPDDAPNHFVINVQDEQVAALTERFREIGVADTKLYPMVRSRLRQLNGMEVNSDDYDSERARRLINREFNLSTAPSLQTDNVIRQGRWWTEQDNGRHIISVESGLAEELGIALGDELGFDINGTIQTFTVTSLRDVDWDTFNINFFTVVPPGVLDDVPASWVTSVYIDTQQRMQLGDIVREFPNITLIDVAVIMQRVRGIMERVSLAVEFIFVFTLLSGLAVLYAAIQANQDERRFENAVLRTLGASRQVLLLGLVAEFSVLGALSGFLAGLSATSLAWVLAEMVFNFDYSFDLTVGLIGVVSGVLIVLSAGMIGTRRVLSSPPVITLRESRTG
jgi:putative ABC transport system permease protein